jgi:hypothetical protein
VHSEIELEFRNVDFYGGRKTGGPGEKPSWQGREPTNNSTHKSLIIIHAVSLPEVKIKSTKILIN